MIPLRSAFHLLILTLAPFAFGVLAPAEAKNVLRWASQGDALTSDPHAVNESPTIAANRQVYESLINRAPDQAKEPCLALSWRLTEDPKIWEFKLREGVTFHEGQPFTADDVVFSFERALSPTSDYKGSLENVTTVKAIDDHTVQIITSGPAPLLPDQLTDIFIISRASESQTPGKAHHMAAATAHDSLTNANNTTSSIDRPPPQPIGSGGKTPFDQSKAGSRSHARPDFLNSLSQIRPWSAELVEQRLGHHPHLTGELFKMMAGVNIVHVPHFATLAGILPVALPPFGRRRSGRPSCSEPISSAALPMEDLAAATW
jgi:hypothetical protein